MSGAVTVLDLHHQTEGTVAAFLVRTAGGPVLVETGPESLFGNLRAAVEAEGFALEEIRHVLVTHIHLDHAGSAWRLAAHGAKVFVHPAGVRHLSEPSRLMASAARIYGDAMERLWGRMESIPADQVVAMEDGATLKVGGATLEAVHTPGHAIHHITWRLGDGLFTGDVGGIRIGAGPVIPPLPPPDIEVETWQASIDKMRATGATTVYPTHFGVMHDAAAHFDSLEGHLHGLSGWMRDRLAEGMTEEALVPAFTAHLHGVLAAHGVDAAGIEAYEIADPAFMSVQGLTRYWNKRGLG